MIAPDPINAGSEGLAAAETLRQAQAGDPEAFCELVREHEERLLRQAVLWCGDAALADDLAQDTLFTAWKQIARFDGRCRFFTWLCGILLNLARNASRKKRPLPVSSLSDDAREHTDRWLDGVVDPTESPEERLHREEREAAIRQCLDRLPGKHREIVYLRFFVDDSLEGIAAALDCPIGTVKSRLSNALEKLQQMPELHRLAKPENHP